MQLAELEKFYKIHSDFYDVTRRFFLFDRQKAIELLEIKDGDKILDLACGTGLNTPLILRKNKDVEIIGIDFSQSMLEKAKQKFPLIRFIQSDVAAYQFSEKFDKIISTYSISMIDEWQKTLLNAKNALKRDGVLVILDFYCWHGLIKFFYPIFKWWLKRHGVNPEKPIATFLKNYFMEVKEIILHSGYDSIVIAKFSK